MTEELLNLITHFIDNAATGESIDIPRLPIYTYDNLFNSIGFDRIDNDGGDTNGWEVDFGYEYSKDDVKITLSGSLWSGDNHQLSKEEI